MRDFLVRLDAELEGGMSDESRAKAIEQWERAPEEWEFWRPVRASPLRPTLRFRCATGEVEIVGHSTEPDGSMAVWSDSAVWRHPFAYGSGVEDVTDALIAETNAGRRPMRVLVSPRRLAALVIAANNMRRFG